MLAQQEPYPAVVVDRRWNLLQANKGAIAMVEYLVGPLTPGAAINLADALVAPDVLRRYLTNWQEVVAYFVRSVEADAAADATKETAALRDRLLSYPGVQESLATPSVETVAAPILPMRFAKGQVSLELFTTLTILGMPQDATLQEMRIESFFPHRLHHGSRGRPLEDHHRIFSGILWRLHTGAPWRDIPEYFGPWQTIYGRFRLWRM